MTDRPVIEFVFWLSLLGLVYIHIGYPLLIAMLARFRPRRQLKERSDLTASIVVVAYNEGHNLANKIRSLLALDESSRIREILIASDGSTDDTIDVVGAFNDPRIRLITFGERRGKPSVLNDVVPQCSGQIVILTDARQEVSSNALVELASNFADPSVGVVSGELMFQSSADTTTASHGVGIYWKYEKFIRKSESCFRSVPGATGALYAMRRSLFRPIPFETILDDVVIPMQAVEQGYRCVFEPAAMAFDRPSQLTRQETLRKRRTIAGSAQMMIRQSRWLLPWKNPIWFEFLSHKISRLLSPFLLLIAAVTNALLAAHPVYYVLFFAHIDFYLAAIAGWMFQRAKQRSVCFGTPWMFLALNGVTLAAIWDAFGGRFQATWKCTVSANSETTG